MDEKVSLDCNKDSTLKVLRVVLLYASEGWTISPTMQSRLETTEMWFLRRMIHIPWIRKVNKMKTILTRQVRFLRHVLHKKKFEHLMRRYSGSTASDLTWMSVSCNTKDDARYSEVLIKRSEQCRRRHILIWHVSLPELNRPFYQIVSTNRHASRVMCERRVY